MRPEGLRDGPALKKEVGIRQCIFRRKTQKTPNLTGCHPCFIKYYKHNNATLSYLDSVELTILYGHLGKGAKSFETPMTEWDLATTTDEQPPSANMRMFHIMTDTSSLSG